MLIEISNAGAKVKVGLEEKFTIVGNSKTELLLYKAHTKSNSGADYPIGFTVIALDRSTMQLIRSNTLVGSDSNNHAFGNCYKA